MSNTTTSTSWRALIPTATVEISGASFQHRKKGAIGTIKMLSEHPVAAAFVERIGNDQLAAGKGLTRAAVEEALADVTAKSGTASGTLVVELARVVTKVATDLVLDVAVIPDEEREDFRAFVEAWGVPECLDFIASFLLLNFPAAHGPFVQLAARLRLTVMVRLSRLETKLATVDGSGSGEPGSPAGTTAPAADEASERAAA